jgi:murein DD-endopeptidase MepM/ murein hydrolase activator NlpD
MYSNKKQNKRLIIKYNLVFFIFSSIFSLPATAKKLYKFQNENGNWIFTDQAPYTDKEIIVKQLDVETKKRVKLLKSENKEEQNYYIYNEYAGPVEVEINFSEKENIYAIPELPHRFVIPSGKSDIIFKIRSINKTNSWKYNIKYNYVTGMPIKNYVSREVYFPPISPNSSFKISQSFGGEFSHMDDQSKYAVDISMPIGTPIFAARDGIVMSVDDDFYKNGLDKKYLSEANSIRILHNDGSMAVYAHLEPEKHQVYSGLKVQTGQLIGYSGNTGFSSGPHLHFAIQINNGMSINSVPFKFINDKGQVEEPILGKTLVGISTLENIIRN